MICIDDDASVSIDKSIDRPFTFLPFSLSLSRVQSLEEKFPTQSHLSISQNEITIEYLCSVKQILTYDSNERKKKK